jgi:hypothetical protein
MLGVDLSSPHVATRDKTKPTFLKVDERHISPDDVLKLIQERDQCIASDTRTAAER